MAQISLGLPWVELLPTGDNLRVPLGDRAMSSLTTALEEIRAWLLEHAPQQASSLAPGLSLTEIQSHLRSFPFALPQEVYDLYLWRNGSGEEAGLFVYHHFLDLDLALTDAALLNDDVWVQARTQEQQPAHVFPLFDFDGEYFVVPVTETAVPAAPVFHVGCDDGALTRAFSSLTAMMQAIAASYQVGLYALDAEGYLHLTDPQKFSEIRRRYNPDTAPRLYAEGW